ncbi:MAG: PIN domain-containing protein [archaeon]
MKVILDTNFIIYCSKEKLDYVEKLRNLLNEDYDLVVPEQVIGELERLKVKAKKGKDKDAADLGLKIIEKNIKERGLKKVKPEGKSVDDAIVNLAQEDKKNIVCTLDSEIRWTLGRVILISKGKKLMLTR